MLLNNDTEVIHDEWLAEMIVLGTQPAIGAVGAKLLYPDRTIQHAGVVLGLHGTVGHLYRAQCRRNRQGTAAASPSHGK
ncbi:MAG: hypothetical protein U1E63_16640 [Burkholderiales bacterium]